MKVRKKRQPKNKEKMNTKQRQKGANKITKRKKQKNTMIGPKSAIKRYGKLGNDIKKRDGVRKEETQNETKKCK